MNFCWTRAAKSHLRAIHDYIAADSPRHAKRFVDVVTRRSESLGRMPRLGSVVPEYANETVREFFQHSYRIIYRIQSDRIDVLAIIHGARELPTDLP